MDLNTLSSFIGSFGFPILACVGMGWFVKYTIDESKKERQELNDAHKKEIAEMTKAPENNTLAIEKLCERFGDN